MSDTFFNPLSQFHNDSIYLDIIRKEDACRNFPSDYKKVISFRKSITNKGKAGSLFPYMLGENKLSLVLVKSEDCRLCKKLDKQVIHSSSIQKAIDDNTLNYFVLDTMNNPEILELIDTRLIPSLYLVNEAGIVIIKGATDISVIVDLLQCHSIL